MIDWDHIAWGELQLCPWLAVSLINLFICFSGNQEKGLWSILLLFQSIFFFLQEAYNTYQHHSDLVALPHAATPLASGLVMWLAIANNMWMEWLVPLCSRSRMTHHEVLPSSTPLLPRKLVSGKCWSLCLNLRIKKLWKIEPPPIHRH